MLLLLLVVATVMVQHGSCRRARARTASPGRSDSSSLEWRMDTLSELDSDSCTIDRVPAGNLSAQAFGERYFARKPVIIVGAASREAWPVAFEKWAKSNMVTHFGDRQVLVRVAPSSCLTDNAECVSASGRALVTLREYLANIPSAPPGTSLEQSRLQRDDTVPYTHDRHFLRTAVPEARSHFTTPPAICDNTPLPCTPNATDRFKEDPLFFVGGAGSGVGFHRHGHAWNAIVYGRKRWFLYPPSFDHTAVSMRDVDTDGIGWARRYLSRVTGTPLAPLECVLGPSEVLYLPAGWNHATINIQETIGVAMNYVLNREALPTVPAAEFHFGTDPVEQITEIQSANGEGYAALAQDVVVACSAEGPPTLSCTQLTVAAATCEVAGYLFNGMDRTGGFPQKGSVASSDIDSARLGLSRLNNLLVRSQPLELATDQQWRRARLLRGLVLGNISPIAAAGALQDPIAAVADIMAGASPVGFLETAMASQALSLGCYAQRQGACNDTVLDMSVTLAWEAIRLRSTAAPGHLALVEDVCVLAARNLVGFARQQSDIGSKSSTAARAVELMKVAVTNSPTNENLWFSLAQAEQAQVPDVSLPTYKYINQTFGEVCARCVAQQQMATEEGNGERCCHPRIAQLASVIEDMQLQHEHQRQENAQRAHKEL